MRIFVWAEEQGWIKIAGIGINACMDYSVASLDAFLTEEGRPDIAIGLDRQATDFGGNPPYQRNMLNRLYSRTNDDAEDAVSMYRRILAQTEEKLDIIEIGYPQVLSGLLQSPPDRLSGLTGVELVKQKVDKLWMMAGNWQDNGSGLENNFARNPRSRAAGHEVCQSWPTPVTFLGWEISSEILTGGTLTSPSDMVAQALRDHGSGNGRSSWDPMLALLACCGKEEEAGYRVITGTASVDAETGRNFFEPSPLGSHGYVVKTKQDDYYRQTIDQILESKQGHSD
jgi:hypothetical protein